MNIIRIGTRGSDLAKVQAEAVKKALEQKGLSTEVVLITTTGDRKQGTEAANFGDKRDWVVELEQAIVNAEVDLVVHSAKDVPVDIEPRTTLVPILPRVNPLDALVLKSSLVNSEPMLLKNLPSGVKIGATGPRRRSQLLRLRPDLKVAVVRGNVPTRLRKLEQDSDLDGVILAAAGLQRLGLGRVVSEELDPDQFIPAVSQGILLGQCREDRHDIKLILQELIDLQTSVCWQAERSFISKIEGDCHTAVGVFARVVDSNVSLIARVLSADGDQVVEGEIKGSFEEAKNIGNSLAQEMLAKGALGLIKGGERVK